MRQLRPLAPLAVLLALAVPGTAAAGSYTVRWGDTLTTLAARFGTSVRSLAEANGLADPNRVLAGRTLSIPGKAATKHVDQGDGDQATTRRLTKATASRAATPVTPPTSVHVVAQGENLTTIAAHAGTTVQNLLKLNHLTNADHIVPGQKLIVPGGGPPMPCPVAGFHTAVNNWGALREGGLKHQGDDIFAPRGVPVIANVNGVLSHIQGAVTGNGYYLRGDDGTVFYGAHLDNYVAAPGRVTVGTVIGHVGNTGDAVTTPTHLHFEIKPGGGAPVDPWPVVSRIC